MRLKDIETKIFDGKSKLDQEEEDFLVSKVHDYWNDHPDVQYRHPRWKKVMAWVAGYQYIDYNRVKKELQPVNVKRTRKLVFNRLKPFIRTVLGKMATAPPQTGVIPKSTEYEDERAAEVGDLVIEALSSADKLNINYVRKIFTLWLILLNRAYLRVYWNEDGSGLKGYGTEVLTDDETGEAVGEDFIQITEPGDVAIEAVSPFNCRPDPLNFEPDKWRWFVFANKVDAEELEEQYGLEEGELKDEDGDDKYDNSYSLTQSGDSDFDIGMPKTEESVSGRTAILYEFWTPKICVFVAGSKVLESKRNPYGRIPYFCYEERIVPIENYDKGIVFNDSIIKDLIPVQREYNRFVSLISLALERATKTKVMAPFDSLVDKKQIYDDGGIVIVDYNRSRGEPHQLKLDPIPSFAITFKQELEREMESGGSLHEVSFGRLPERASHASGVMVDTLIEQDDQTFDPLTREIDSTFSKAWSLAMQIVQDNYVTKRLLKVCGRDSLDSIIYFQGADLKGNTDVLVTSQVGLPKSRPLRIQYIMNMRQAGLITDDKLALELMEFGQAKRVFGDQLLHERKARRENMIIETTKNLEPTPQQPMVQTPDMQSQMQQPSQVQMLIQQLVYDGDDDTIHLKTHMRDRLSAKFEQYGPGQKEALEMMINWHKQRIMQAQQAQMQQMMMMEQMKAQMKGAGKETPAPSGSTSEEATQQTPENG